MRASTMSSATSTRGGLAPRAPTQQPVIPSSEIEHGLRPWQFFVLAALGCATAVTWMARAQGFVAVLLLTIVMGTVALAALAMLRTVSPLVSREEDRTPMVGERTRAALEREKLLTLRAIKELEFDRAMNKLSEEDFTEMSGRLRLRAARLIRQLDAGSGYRERVEKDLLRRMGERAEELGTSPAVRTGIQDAGAVVDMKVCAKCSTANDPDARFCKACGAQL
jgi:hypothetical protein